MTQQISGRQSLPCLATLLVLLALPFAAEADKTDIIQLQNGDRLTGEIKRLDRGRVQLSTDSLGTVYIEWKDITRVTSKELYVIELVSGTRIEGTLAEPTDDGELLIRDGDNTAALPMGSVVWIDPLKLDENRLKRWDGAVSAGFDATKANNDTSLSASLSARRRGEDFLLGFNGSLYSRSQDDAEDSLRANFNGVYRRLLEDRWFWAAVGSVERNDELGIDLRSLAGLGYGRFLVQTGRSLWSLTGGLAVVNEQREESDLGIDEDSSETDLEAFIGSDFEFFTYDTPKTTFTTSLVIFPSLTAGGRVRGNLDLALRREIVTDLFVEISIYDSYDSDPPEGAENNDYGIVTSLGYSF